MITNPVPMDKQALWYMIRYQHLPHYGLLTSTMSMIVTKGENDFMIINPLWMSQKYP